MRSLFITVMMVPVLVLISACRPSSQDNFLYDNASEQVQITISDQASDTKAGITFKGPTGKKLTKLKELSVTTERTGKFTASADRKFVSLYAENEKPQYSLELIMDTDTSCKTATAGVTLNHTNSFNVACVSESALTNQLKAACKELSSEPAVAEYDETKTYCSCLKRENKNLKYSDYTGRVSFFKIECKNTATPEQIKSMCSDIKEKQCPTCEIGTLSCKCPKKVTLVYDDFSQNVEGFRNQCEMPPSTLVANPVSDSLTTTQQNELFDTSCKKVGTLTESAATPAVRSCKCTNGLSVAQTDWKKNQHTLESVCTEALEPENPALLSFESDCKLNNGLFNFTEVKNKDESICTCKSASGSASSTEVTFKDYKTNGVKSIKDACGPT